MAIYDPSGKELFGMIMYNPSGIAIYGLAVSDESYRYRAIMGEDALTIMFKSEVHVEIPIGSYTIFRGVKYTLHNPQNIKKNAVRNFEYSMVLESPQSVLSKYKFKSIVDGKLKFSLTEKPEQFMNWLVGNLNLDSRETGWSVGSVIVADEKLLSFSHNNCSEALRMISEAYETEFEFDFSGSNKIIHLRKVEYKKNDPLPISYGKGNGFISGVRRDNPDMKTRPIERLYVQGGSRNINRATYGHQNEGETRVVFDSSELLLPKGKTYTTGTQTYKVDALGYSIYKYPENFKTKEEGSLDCSDIYPKREGIVTNIFTIDEAKNIYEFEDNTIPDNLNYNDFRIGGEKATIIFQSGILAGREFDIRQTENALIGYTHTKDGLPYRRFRLEPAEQDGIMMPNATFKPKAKDGSYTGDRYSIFGITMPDVYIRNDLNQTGASWEMFAKAVTYFASKEVNQFSFTGELSPIWVKKEQVRVGSKFPTAIVLGGYINFSDEQFQDEVSLIRITGIRENINKPFLIQLELSNAPVGVSFSSAMGKIETTAVAIDKSKKDVLNFAKRSFRDSRETAKALEAAMIDGFTSSISPITINTMQLLVGDESLQFYFVANTSSVDEISHREYYDKATKVFVSDDGILQHKTLGITNIQMGLVASKYKMWNMDAYSQAVLDSDKDKLLYVYAEVSKTLNTGRFVVSNESVRIDDVAGYYYLLVGLLNSEQEGDRSYIPMYGFTEITPARIVTKAIVSNDGNNYLDLANNAFNLGSELTEGRFNYQNGVLNYRGRIIQTHPYASPQTPAFERGNWSASEAYVVADLVQYLGSTYYCILQNENVVPPNATYWKIWAGKGENGKDGNNFEYIYCLTTNVTAPTNPSFLTTPNTGSSANKTLDEFFPVGTTSTGSILGWHDNMPSVDATYKYVWISVREKKYISGVYQWDEFQAPALRGNYAKDGNVGSNGNGLETVFKRNNTGVAGDAPTSVNTDGYVPSGYTASPQGVTESLQYEYESKRIFSGGAWGAFSIPVLRSRWSVDGADALSIVLSQETRLINCNAGGDIRTGQDSFYILIKTLIGNTLGNIGNISIIQTPTNAVDYLLSATGIGQFVLEIEAINAISSDVISIIISNGTISKTLTLQKVKDGYAGASLISRGSWTYGVVYNGSQNSIDVVSVTTSGVTIWYKAKTTAGTFTSYTSPATDTTKWEAFDTVFQNIATGTLFAENANVGEFIFKGGRLISQYGTLFGSPSGNYTHASFIPNTILDGVNGTMKVNGEVNASSGRFGELKIVDGYLKSGAVKITNANIPYVPVITTPTYGYMSKNSGWSGGTATTQNFTANDKSTLEFKIQSFVGGGGGAGWYWALYKWDEAAYEFDYYAGNVDTTSYTKDYQSCELVSGTYQLYAAPYATSGGSPTIELFGSDTDGIMAFKYYDRRNVFGGNGQYFVADKEHYFYYRHDDRMEVRFGQVTFRIDDSGVYTKTGSSAWNKLS